MSKSLMLILCFLLAGCVTGRQPRLDSLSPVCVALVGPIKYNSTVRTSARFAGRALAPDLKQRNQVGRSLGCAAYR